MRIVLLLFLLCLVGLNFLASDTTAEPVVTLDSVSGLDGSGSIVTGQIITFYVGLDLSSLSADEYLPWLGLDFEISSPDGCEWTATSHDTVPLPASYNDWEDYYFSALWFHIYDTDGSSPDRVGFDALRNEPCLSLPAGFVGTILKFDIGPIDESHIGKTICIDKGIFFDATVEYAPGCVFQSQQSYTPGWAGPYCYTVDEPTAIAGVDNLNSLPSEFTVRQNYPNPFNGQTVITFTAPRAGNYSMNIFNILGQKVHTQTIVVQQPGERQVAVDADRLGLTASGIYFYQVSNGQDNIRKKMLYLK